MRKLPPCPLLPLAPRSRAGTPALTPAPATQTEGLRGKDGPPPRVPQGPSGSAGVGVPAGGRVGSGPGLPALSPVCSRGKDGRTVPAPPAPLTWVSRTPAGSSPTPELAEPRGAGLPPLRPPRPLAPSAPQPRRLTIKGEAWGRGPGIPAERKRPLPAPPPGWPRPVPPPPPPFVPSTPPPFPLTRAERVCSLPHCPPPYHLLVPPPPCPLCTLSGPYPTPSPRSTGLVALPALSGGGGVYTSFWLGISQGPQS